MCKVDTVHHSMVSKWYRQYWVCVTHSLPLSWSELYHCFILVEASLTNILAMPAGRNFIIFCISVCEYLCLGLGVHPVWVAAGQPGMAVTAQLTTAHCLSSGVLSPSIRSGGSGVIQSPNCIMSHPVQQEKKTTQKHPFQPAVNNTVIDRFFWLVRRKK